MAPTIEPVPTDLSARGAAETARRRPLSFEHDRHPLATQLGGAVAVSARTNPVFVVGCSRGGTTLLQSILNQHPALISFPETNVLHKVLDDLEYRRFGALVGYRRVPMYLLKRGLNRLGWTFSYKPGKFRAYLAALDREDLSYLVPQNTRSIARVFSAFRNILEAMAEGRRYIEKTPQNIFCIEFIAKQLADAQFVHIVRDGRENVASLYSAGRKYPDFETRFGGERGLLKAIHYWNNALRISYRYRHDPRHVIVRYEDLVADPMRALEPAARFLGIDLKDEMFRYDTSGIIFDFETHKMIYPQMIVPQQKKYDTLFTDEQKATIDGLLLSADAHFPTRL